MSSPGRRSWLSAGTFTSDSGDGRPAWIPSLRLFVVPEPKHPGPIRPGVPPGALANTEGRSPGPLQQLQNYALATRREHNWSVVASPSTRTAFYSSAPGDHAAQHRVGCDDCVTSMPTPIPTTKPTTTPATRSRRSRTTWTRSSRCSRPVIVLLLIGAARPRARRGAPSPPLPTLPPFVRHA